MLFWLQTKINYAANCVFKVDAHLAAGAERADVIVF